MKNKIIAEQFANGETEKTKGSNLFIDGKVIYSYGYHFPIAIKLEDGFIFNKDGYSKSTARHKTYVLNAIKICRAKLILKGTNELKDIISRDVKSINELALKEIAKSNDDGEKEINLLIDNNRKSNSFGTAETIQYEDYLLNKLK